MDTNARRLGTAHRGRRAHGYSMVEQISCLSIACILITMGVPSYRYVSQSSRVSEEVNGLLADMKYARSEALTTGQSVTVCPSHDGQTCTTGSQEWESGWIVFADPQGTGTVDSDTAILRVQPGFTGPRDVLLAPAGVFFVTYNREGFATKLPVAIDGSVTFTLHTDPVNTQWTRCLSVTPVGMITTQRVGQGGCQ